MYQSPYPHPPCHPQFDEHLSWIYNKGLDQEPTIGATFFNENAYPVVSPWQFEIIGGPKVSRGQSRSTIGMELRSPRIPDPEITRF